MMKMKMKKKIRSRRYDKNKLRSRHGHKYSKYKKCLIMMMLLCIKQHLSNFGSSIHEEVKHHPGRLEKKALLILKKAYGKFCCHHHQICNVCQNKTQRKSQNS